MHSPGLLANRLRQQGQFVPGQVKVFGQRGFISVKELDPDLEDVDEFVLRPVERTHAGEG